MKLSTAVANAASRWALAVGLAEAAGEGAEVAAAGVESDGLFEHPASNAEAMTADRMTTRYERMIDFPQDGSPSLTQNRLASFICIATAVAPEGSGPGWQCADRISVALLSCAGPYVS
jgi:hypothetical protein